MMADAYSDAISEAMQSVKSRNTGHTAVTQAQVQARVEQRELQELEARAHHASVKTRFASYDPPG